MTPEDRLDAHWRELASMAEQAEWRLMTPPVYRLRPGAKIALDVLALVFAFVVGLLLGHFL